MRLLPHGLRRSAFHFLAVVLAVPAAAQEPADSVPADLARLVPEDACVLIVTSSIAAAEPALEAAEKSFLPDNDTTPNVIRLMAQSLCTPRWWDEVLRDQPLAVAFSCAYDEDHELLGLTPTFIVPVRDPAILADAAELVPRARSTAHSGSYIALSKLENYTGGGEPRAFARALPAGLFVLRADVDRLLPAWRGDFDSFLDSMAGPSPADDAAIEELGYGSDATTEPSSPPPAADPSMAAAARTLRQAFELLQVSARRFDLVVRVEGTRWDLDAHLQVAPGSALALAAQPAPQLPELAARLDSEQPILLLTSLGLADTLGWSLKISELQLSALPAETAAALRSIQAETEALYAGLEGGQAGEGGLGAVGMRAAIFFPAKDITALIERQRALLQSDAGKAVWSRVEGPSTRTVQGIEITRFSAGYDLEKLIPEGQDTVLVREVLQVLYGPEATVNTSFAGAAGLGLAAVGDEAFVDSAAARLGKAAAPPPGLATALARVPAGPNGILSLDAPRLLSQVAEGLPMLSAFLPSDLGEISAPVTAYAGAAEGGWRLGLLFDCAPLGEAYQALGW